MIWLHKCAAAERTSFKGIFYVIENTVVYISNSSAQYCNQEEKYSNRVPALNIDLPTAFSKEREIAKWAGRECHTQFLLNHLQKKVFGSQYFQLLKVYVPLDKECLKKKLN